MKKHRYDEKEIQAQILSEIIAQAYLGILRLGFSREEIDMGIYGMVSSMQRKDRLRVRELAEAAKARASSSGRSVREVRVRRKR